jgi:SAM-dependent methyltransferase
MLQGTCKSPNQYARSPRLELFETLAVFHGYQEFAVTRNSLCVLAEDVTLQLKQRLLAQFFTPQYLSRRSVLDLGGNSAFFCFWALQQGAASATVVDIDPDYLQMVETVRTKLGFHKLATAQINVADWETPADFVIALALIHWMYSCTAVCGSIDAIIEKLARLTKYLLVLEWIEPTDTAIALFHHLDWNKDSIRGPYSLDAFEMALQRHFARYQCIGNISPTRKLYAAFRTPLDIDLSVPLPILYPPETILYSRLLAEHNGIEYWSVIYDGDDVIYKQTTLDLAEREAALLSKLESSYFPRVRGLTLGNDFSVVELEKIVGEPLLKAVKFLRADRTRFYKFICHCLDILNELRRVGIIHRDICAENILLRDEEPVLLDFSWALSDNRPCITPPGLGRTGRPSDGSFSDIYSMGKVFEQVNEHCYPEFDLVIALMTALDPLLRVSDVDILRTLFNSVSE